MSTYCELCQGPVKDEDDFMELHQDGATTLYFCNEKEERDWLENHPEEAADIIMNDPELVERTGW